MKNAYDEESLIIWQKWFDPFGDDDNLDEPMTSDDEDDSLEENLEVFDDPLLKKPLKAIATPMGLIPYTENTASSKIFNFWVGHTNFSISPKIADIIESIDGVETFDLFTRYRFRIGIGKAFDSPKVMKHINDNVYTYLE